MRQSERFNKVIGAHIRNLRTLRGIRQRRLATALGVDVPAVSRIENGSRELRISQIRKLARALGMRPTELLAPLDEEAAR